MLLSSGAGASRLLTLLRLEELKAPSPLPRRRAGAAATR